MTAQVVDNWLEQHIDPQTGYALDDSLTSANSAAQAKKVGDEISDLKSAIGVVSGSELISMNWGFIRTNKSTGIDKDAVESSSGSRYAVVRCAEGDTFTIRCYTVTGAANLAYVFIDTSGNRLEPYAGNGVEYDNVIITAPENAEYAIIQSRSAYNPYCIKGSPAITAVENEIAKLEQSMCDTLLLIGKGNGFMVDDGTITGTTADRINKYAVRSGTSKIYITGQSNLSAVVDGTKRYCVLWFVSGGNMMSGQYVQVVRKPQSWDNYEVTVPSGAEEVWLYSNMSLSTGTGYEYDIGQRIRGFESDINQRISDIETGALAETALIEKSMRDTLRLKSMSNGVMVDDGTIYGSAENATYKYALTNGVEKLYISGNSNMNATAGTGKRFCALWFVSGGSMMPGQYVQVTSKPQSWNDYEVTVPEGAEEVWVYKNISFYVSADYAYDIGQRIRSLEVDKSALFFNGLFTWTERVFGLRMLADAQGCYFIPFNALGHGISRGNGTDGNSYYADNIHPSRLGAYNLALGVWSYLRHIPCWHTVLPNDTSTAPAMDGTQWAGKTWYAYGTSLTAGTIGSAGSSSSNRYVDFVQAMSGMTLVNKGYGGGALVSPPNRQIYNRLMDMTDGKLTADLITIEVGANDSGPTGYPWSLDTKEFYGALNHCIREMFAAGVKAQIVIMASYPPRYPNGFPDEKYDVDRLVVRKNEGD